MKKFLIIQTSYIGDVILVTALLEKLYFHYINAQIDILVRKGNETLLQNNPVINEILVWDKKIDKHKNLTKLIKYIRNEKYDYVINCHRFTSSGLITATSKSPNKIGFSNNPLSFTFTKRVKHEISKGIHEIDRNQSLIAHLTESTPSKPKLYPSDNDFNKVKAYKANPYICMAPASVWFTKQFPIEKWVELIQKLNNKYNIYLLGSEKDQEYCNQILIKANQDNIRNLAGKLDILKSAALMKDAAMNYVNDSAPMHIASAMDANVTAIFCSTVTDFGFGPLSEKSKVVQTKIHLKCRPCGIHGHNSCPEKHFNCAYSIDVEDLLF